MCYGVGEKAQIGFFVTVKGTRQDTVIFCRDRKDMPSRDKPRQERLMGWETTVIKGTTVSLDRGSPMLNHANSSEDRKQVIASSPYVTFEDGEYTMTAKVMNSDGFGKLEMFATSGGRAFSTAIKGANSTWTTITLEGIRVSGNKVEIGFLAGGKRRFVLPGR